MSELGAPHVVDPSRLIASARRLYGDDLDRLWGEPEPVPAESRARHDRAASPASSASRRPATRAHHVCYLDSNGVLYAGDAAGVRILPGDHVRPHAPPPEVDLEGWKRTFDEIERRSPVALALVHFGVAEDVGEHLARTRETLASWAARVRDGMAEPAWVAAAEREHVERDGADGPKNAEPAAPLAQSYAGLVRYWRKRGEAS